MTENNNKSAGKSRSWCFTLNNYIPEDENVFRELECKYLICGREISPTTGTKHLQGYVYFKNPRSLQGVREIHPEAHWEKAKGNAEQNREYCTKEGDYFETGLIPMSQKRKGEVEQERWDNAWKKAKSGDIEGIDSDIKFRYYRTCKDIARDYMPKLPDLTELENVWLYGPPGVGKSRSARILYPGAYFKAGNKWWDGYQGEENVIIDDFELDFKCLGHYLKIWADRYSFIAEYKGGSMHIRPKRIIVTSNYSIEEVFAADQTMVGAVKRRFEQRHIQTPLTFEELVIIPESPCGISVDEAREEEAVGDIWDDDYELDLSVFDEV